MPDPAARMQDIAVSDVSKPAQEAEWSMINRPCEAS